MKRFKGTVKNNIVVLEEGVHLPDGIEVEVRLPTNRRGRDEAIRRIRRNPIQRFVGIDDIIEEDKREREERWDVGGSAE